MAVKAPIWAPWRMSYILSEKPSGCVLCELSACGVNAESLVLHVGPDAFVVLNRYPYINGHLMVVPRAHVPSMSALDLSAFQSTTALLRESARIVEEVLRPEGLNVGLNQGRAAGAGLDEHMHFHIVPRWVGDANYVSVVGDTRVINEALESTWAKLHPHFATL